MSHPVPHILEILRGWISIEEVEAKLFSDHSAARVFRYIALADLEQRPVNISSLSAWSGTSIETTRRKVHSLIEMGYVRSMPDHGRSQLLRLAPDVFDQLQLYFDVIVGQATTVSTQILNDQLTSADLVSQNETR